MKIVLSKIIPICERNNQELTVDTYITTHSRLSLYSKNRIGVRRVNCTWRSSWKTVSELEPFKLWNRNRICVEAAEPNGIIAKRAAVNTRVFQRAEKSRERGSLRKICWMIEKKGESKWTTRQGLNFICMRCARLIVTSTGLTPIKSKLPKLPFCSFLYQPLKLS